MLGQLAILSLMTLAQAQIRIDKISNPILPFSLGKARVTSQKHSFIKYIDLTNFDAPILSLKTNIKTITPLIKVKDELYPQLNNIHEHLEYLLNQVENKLKNVKPLGNTRTKRGLLNIVGKASKWAFGTLDSDDAKRYDNAISILESNQKEMHTDLENYLTITKNFMNETILTFEKITRNQNEINTRLRTIEQNLNKYTLFLRLQNILDNMIIDCLSLITILDNIQDAILFAHLESIHSSILPISELINLTKIMSTLYIKGIPEFKNIQSYYELIKTEIYYVQQTVCFIFHFPILSEGLYDYYHLFPIPALNKTIIPLKPFILINSTYHHYEELPCPHIEDLCLYHVTQTVSQRDCLPQVLSGTRSTSCQTTDVTIKNDILEQINNAYVIAIPAINMTIEKQCDEHGYTTINQPHLIYIPQKCSISINGHEFHNVVGLIPGTPLEILPIKMLTTEDNNQEVAPYKQIDTNRLADIKRMADETHLHKLKTLSDISGSDHTDLYICLSIIAFILLILFLKSLYFKKPKIFQTLFKFRKDAEQSNQDVSLKEIQKTSEKTNSFIFSA